MANIEIEFVLINNNNKINIGTSNLLYRKQNATHYRKNKSNTQFLSDKLETQIKDKYKNDVVLLKSIDFKDHIYTFYNVKNRKKNKNQDIPKLLEKDKIMGDIMIFKQNKKTCYFECFDLDCFNKDLEDILQSYKHQDKSVELSVTDNVSSTPDNVSSAPDNVSSTPDNVSSAPDNVSSTPDNVSSALDNLSNTLNVLDNTDENTDIELDIECSDIECSDIEFTDDEDTNVKQTQNKTNNTNDIVEDVDIDIDDLDVEGDGDIYLDENDNDDNDDNELDVDIDELDDDLDNEDGDEFDEELENNYNLNLTNSIISTGLSDSLTNSVNETVEKKKKKTKSYNNFKNNFSVLTNILDMEEVNKLTPIKSLHEIRQNNIKILSKIPVAQKCIRTIEQGIYNYSITRCEENYFMPTWDSVEFKDTYINKSRTIFSNLVTNNYIGNDYLLNKIKDKSIDCYQIAFMEFYELFPKKWQDIIDEKIKIEEILKNELQGTATDQFKCHRCKTRKTIFVQVQTRSADEPMTTFITCLNCGNKWKQ
jgi:DNA-directed RNA polymerase subunit M/transcription elongation factor TFIIS